MIHTTTPPEYAKLKERAVEGRYIGPLMVRPNGSFWWGDCLVDYDGDALLSTMFDEVRDMGNGLFDLVLLWSRWDITVKENDGQASFS